MDFRTEFSSPQGAGRLFKPVGRRSIAKGEALVSDGANSSKPRRGAGDDSDVFQSGISPCLSTRIPSPLVRGWMVWAGRDFQGCRPSLLTVRPYGALAVRTPQFGSQKDNPSPRAAPDSLPPGEGKSRQPGLPSPRGRMVGDEGRIFPLVTDHPPLRGFGCPDASIRKSEISFQVKTNINCDVLSNIEHVFWPQDKVRDVVRWSGSGIYRYSFSYSARQSLSGPSKRTVPWCSSTPRSHRRSSVCGAWLTTSSVLPAARRAAILS